MHHLCFPVQPLLARQPYVYVPKPVAAQQTHKQGHVPAVHVMQMPQTHDHAVTSHAGDMHKMEAGDWLQGQQALYGTIPGQQVMPTQVEGHPAITSQADRFMMHAQLAPHHEQTPQHQHHQAASMHAQYHQSSLAHSQASCMNSQAAHPTPRPVTDQSLGQNTPPGQPGEQSQASNQSPADMQQPTANDGEASGMTPPGEQSPVDMKQPTANDGEASGMTPPNNRVHYRAFVG